MRKQDEIPAHIWYIDRETEPHKIVMRVGFSSRSIPALVDEFSGWIDSLDQLIGISSDPLSIRLHPFGRREQIPKLLGLSDIARLMKVSRQRVKQLADSDKGFPLSIAATSAGPLYSDFEVRAWLASRRQRQGVSAPQDSDMRAYSLVKPSSETPSWVRRMYTYTAVDLAEAARLWSGDDEFRRLDGDLQ